MPTSLVSREPLLRSRFFARLRRKSAMPEAIRNACRMYGFTAVQEARTSSMCASAFVACIRRVCLVTACSELPHVDEPDFSRSQDCATQCSVPRMPPQQVGPEQQCLVTTCHARCFVHARRCMLTGIGTDNVMNASLRVRAPVIPCERSALRQHACFAEHVFPKCLARRRIDADSIERAVMPAPMLRHFLPPHASAKDI